MWRSPQAVHHMPAWKGCPAAVKLIATPQDRPQIRAGTRSVGSASRRHWSPSYLQFGRSPWRRGQVGHDAATAKHAGRPAPGCSQLHRQRHRSAHAAMSCLMSCTKTIVYKIRDTAARTSCTARTNQAHFMLLDGLTGNLTHALGASPHRLEGQYAIKAAADGRRTVGENGA